MDFISKIIRRRCGDCINEGNGWSVKPFYGDFIRGLKVIPLGNENDFQGVEALNLVYFQPWNFLPRKAQPLHNHCAEALGLLHPSWAGTWFPDWCSWDYVGDNSSESPHPCIGRGSAIALVCPRCGNRLKWKPVTTSTPT